MIGNDSVIITQVDYISNIYKMLLVDKTYSVLIWKNE
jgi:hypothetical protein